MRSAPLVCLLLLLSCAIQVRSEQVSFKITPSAAKPKLAEKFALRFELTCPADYEVSPDTSAFDSAAFELSGTRRLSAKISGASKTEIFELDVIPFTLGVSTFPETAWLLGKGGEIKKASGPAFTIEILPLFKNSEGEDIRDIYPPFKFIPWLLYVLLALLAAAAAYIAFKKLRKPAATGPGGSLPDTRTPYQKALEELTALLASGLWEENKIKEFYIALSGIFRNYLDAQFGIHAELMTTNDITREIKKTGIHIKTVISAREFLEDSDLVKFARFRPGLKERDESVTNLKDLLTAFSALIEDQAKPEPGTHPHGQNPEGGPA